MTELRGAGRFQTFNMMIIRGNTLRQSDGRDQSNRPNNQLKMKRAQRGGRVSKMTLLTTDHLRILLPVKLVVAQDEIHPSRPEGGEEHTTKTTGRPRGTGTRYQRARRHRQVRPNSRAAPKVFFIVEKSLNSFLDVSNSLVYKMSNDAKKSVFPKARDNILKCLFRSQPKDI